MFYLSYYVHNIVCSAIADVSFMLANWALSMDNLTIYVDKFGSYLISTHARKYAMQACAYTNARTHTRTHIQIHTETGR